MNFGDLMSGPVSVCNYKGDLLSILIWYMMILIHPDTQVQKAGLCSYD